ncbi:unnamed protein product [Polarella glacialis]|uniref:Transmembrane protein n=1 Tax=Polarella glacialis TaxID=89957 RepID=A0A813KLK1_POLGL|nr:unnamed protein product [Polarella glacialis]CAE8704545.1 unnamed protein product [Polarella glacialis]
MWRATWMLTHWLKAPVPSSWVALSETMWGRPTSSRLVRERRGSFLSAVSVFFDLLLLLLFVVVCVSVVFFLMLKTRIVVVRFCFCFVFCLV